MEYLLPMGCLRPTTIHKLVTGEVVYLELNNQWGICLGRVYGDTRSPGFDMIEFENGCSITRTDVDIYVLR